MDFLARLFRFLFWVLVISWGIRLLRRVIARMFGSNAPASPVGYGARTAEGTGAIARRLVRDPVCGVHISEERALALRNEGEVVYFCSTDCRDKYMRNNRGMAAAG